MTTFIDNYNYPLTCVLSVTTGIQRGGAAINGRLHVRLCLTDGSSPLLTVPRSCTVLSDEEEADALVVGVSTLL